MPVFSTSTAKATSLAGSSRTLPRALAALISLASAFPTTAFASFENRTETEVLSFIRLRPTRKFTPMLVTLSLPPDNAVTSGAAGSNTSVGLLITTSRPWSVISTVAAPSIFRPSERAITAVPTPLVVSNVRLPRVTFRSPTISRASVTPVRSGPVTMLPSAVDSISSTVETICTASPMTASRLSSNALTSSLLTSKVVSTVSTTGSLLLPVDVVSATGSEVGSGAGVAVAGSGVGVFVGFGVLVATFLILLPPPPPPPPPPLLVGVLVGVAVAPPALTVTVDVTMPLAPSSSCTRRATVYESSLA